MSNEHVHPIMAEVLNTFAPTAMAERYKAANNGKADLQPTLVAMMNAVSRKNSLYDPDYYYMLSTEILLEYIYDWAGGTKTDKDLLDLIRIRVTNTQAGGDEAMEAQQ